MAAKKYACANCGADVTKEPLKASKEADGTLGSFNCTAKCKRGKVKVRRSTLREQ